MRFFKNEGRAGSRRRTRVPVHLTFDLFEDRVLLTANVVNSTALAGAGSLLDAITKVNAGTNDAIDFSIGSGQQTITLTATLPAITKPVVIDATTQPGFSGTPIIQIAGAGLSGAPDGLTLSATAGNSVIKGLVITGFQGAAIHVQSSGNTFTDNFLGTDFSGTVAGPGNQVGVLIDGGSGNAIGGTNAGDPNIIAFNTGGAVHVISGNQNAIHQNLIYGNGAGIVLDAGANHGQTQPTQLAVTTVPGLTTIDLAITPTATGLYTIEFFTSSTSGVGPAFQYLGSKTETLGASEASFTESFTFPAALLAGQKVTATGTSPTGDSSAFAASVSATNPYLVTNTTDKVPGFEVGSLRQAILNANTNPGTDTISFQIPGSGPYVIHPSSALPTLLGAALIDGTTQTGFLGTPLIQIDGNGQPFDGLTLGTGANGSTIRGLDIRGFGHAAIHIQSSGNLVQANFLGTTVDGTATGPGNLQGLFIDNSASNTIGGLGGFGNLISGNTGPGVLVSGASAQNNVLLGNLIGTDASGTVAVANMDGVQISNASSNTIGGATTSRGNIIAFNSGEAVNVLSGHGNTISHNSIFQNNQGIHLASGANDNQSPPTIDSVNSVGNSTTIQAHLSFGAAGANTTYAVEFFASIPGDPTTQGQAHRFLGSVSVTTDALGNAPINQPFGVGVLAGQAVTGTATSATTNSTSPFASSVTVGNP